jgi:hypothetical protein
MKQAQLKQDAMSDASSGPQMAIIMLGSPELPSDEALKRAISARLPSVAFGEAEVPNVFLLNGALCTVGRVGATAPISRQDSCFVAAWYWPKAWNFVKNHKAHVIVSVGGANAKRAPPSSASSSLRVLRLPHHRLQFTVRHQMRFCRLRQFQEWSHAEAIRLRQCSLWASE